MARERDERASGGEFISVCVRVRPANRREKAATAIRCHGDHSLEVNARKHEMFSCARVFGPATDQSEVYNRCGVRGLLSSSLAGYRATMFAYGQTGSGKTHTVLGSDDHDQYSEGIIPRLIREALDLRDQIYYAGDRDIKLRVSLIEVYREVVHDLLAPAEDRHSLHVREHPKYGFFVDGLLLQPCKNVDDTLGIVHDALADRKVCAHNLNSRSSRSHCMLSLHIDSLPMNGSTTPPTYGSLTMVDLAGSERPKETGSKGDALREAGHINRSLYTLGKVIRALTVRQKRGIGPKGPFRDSCLTKLLIGSLGGAGKTVMVACVSPTQHAAPESMRTLRFAMQVKGIQNKPVIQLDPREKLINDLRGEISRLREENAELREKLRTSTAQSEPATPLPLIHKTAYRQDNGMAVDTRTRASSKFQYSLPELETSARSPTSPGAQAHDTSEGPFPETHHTLHQTLPSSSPEGHWHPERHLEEELFRQLAQQLGQAHPVSHNDSNTTRVELPPTPVIHSKTLVVPQQPGARRQDHPDYQRRSLPFSQGALQHKTNISKPKRTGKRMKRGVKSRGHKAPSFEDKKREIRELLESVKNRNATGFVY